MDYSFLVDTYASERLKTLSVWSMFLDDDFDIRPTLCSVAIGLPMSIWSISA